LGNGVGAVEGAGGCGRGGDSAEEGADGADGVGSLGTSGFASGESPPFDVDVDVDDDLDAIVNGRMPLAAVELDGDPTRPPRQPASDKTAASSIERARIPVGIRAIRKEDRCELCFGARRLSLLLVPPSISEKVPTSQRSLL
jgi:hypothetical protein